MANLYEYLKNRTNASGDNVQCYFFNNEPLLTKGWDYAIIVEVEDDQKKGRVSAVGNNGREIGTLVSHTPQEGTQTSHFYSNRGNGLGNNDLMRELDKYLPKHLQSSQDLDLSGILK